MKREFKSLFCVPKPSILLTQTPQNKKTAKRGFNQRKKQLDLLIHNFEPIVGSLNGISGRTLVEFEVVEQETALLE